MATTGALLQIVKYILRENRIQSRRFSWLKVVEGGRKLL